MHSIGTMMRTTKARAVELDVSRNCDEFEAKFGIRIGDFIEVNRGYGFRPARILVCEQIYWTISGYWRAYVRLATLTSSGNLSTARGAYLLINNDRADLRIQFSTATIDGQVRLPGSASRPTAKEYV